MLNARAIRAAKLYTFGAARAMIPRRGGQTKMPANRKVYLGVDIGGTKVAAGLVDARGKILCKTRVPVSSTGSEAEGLASVEKAIEAALKLKPRLRNAVAAIGISSPGPLDPRRSEEHTSELQSPVHLVCRLLL